MAYSRATLSRVQMCLHVPQQFSLCSLQSRAATVLEAQLLWTRLSAAGCDSTHTMAQQCPLRSPEVQGSHRPLGAQETRVLSCPPPAPELQGPGNDHIAYVMLLLWVQPDGVTWPARRKEKSRCEMGTSGVALWGRLDLSMPGHLVCSRETHVRPAALRTGLHSKAVQGRVAGAVAVHVSAAGNPEGD